MYQEYLRDLMNRLMADVETLANYLDLAGHQLGESAVDRLICQLALKEEQLQEVMAELVALNHPLDAKQLAARAQRAALTRLGLIPKEYLN